MRYEEAIEKLNNTAAEELSEKLLKLENREGLSEEEREELPFSLLSAYPKAVITSDATPDTDTAEPTKEALTADTPAVDTATEDIPSDAAPTEDTPAEDTLSDEKTPIEAPSVLVM